MEQPAGSTRRPKRRKTAIMAVLQNTQFVVTSLTLYFVLLLRSAHAIWFSIGTLVAAFSAKILKKFIKQPRPTGAKKFEKTYGMPSTHSSSIAFFGVYLALSSIFLPFHPRLVPSFAATFFQPLATSSVEESILLQLFRFVLAVFWLVAAGSVCWSRVKLEHHTRAQVIAGAALGSTVAIVWFTLWEGLEWEGVPSWLAEGVKQQGLIWERALEDVVFLVVEAWEKGEWRELLSEGVARFPLVEKPSAIDEL